MTLNDLYEKIDSINTLLKLKNCVMISTKVTKKDIKLNNTYDYIETFQVKLNKKIHYNNFVNNNPSLFNFTFCVTNNKIEKLSITSSTILKLIMNIDLNLPNKVRHHISNYECFQLLTIYINKIINSI